jgi:hypothetical protein
LLLLRRNWLADEKLVILSLLSSVRLKTKGHTKDGVGEYLAHFAFIIEHILLLLRNI